MIWLTWRQARFELLIGGAVVALLASFFIWNGLTANDAYRDAGLPACAAHQADDETCRAAAQRFIDQFGGGLKGLRTVFLVCLPFLIGLLLASPTVLDLEQGTYRLAWMQSVTRRRWLATKIAFGVIVCCGAAATLVALMTWWRGPVDTIIGRFNGNAYEFEGVVPIAYTVFAFALCLTLGAVLRSAVPAIGVSFVLFFLARALMADNLRENFLAPITLTWTPTEAAPASAPVEYFGDGSWILDRGYADATGRLPGEPAMVGDCIAETSSKSGDLLDRCLQNQGIVSVISFHPGDRFWIFQGMESALFLALSVVLLAIASWWIVRRTA